MMAERAPLPVQPDTAAEMRDLYRAAESRAARMRLLSASGKELAKAGPDSIAGDLQQSADRLAFFLGSRSAMVSEGDDGEGIAIIAPGSAQRSVARIAIDGIGSIESIDDPEDREAVLLHLELMGATIDRIARERERADLLSALQDREKQLEYLVGKIFSAQEEERLRVTQELHDGVAQTAPALARLLDGAGAGAMIAMPVAERGRLAGIARDLVRELRSVIGGLRPTLLDDLGLEAALRALADALAADGYRVTLASNAQNTRLAATIETALFRVAQEAIANIRKHAGGPCEVAIELALGDDSADRFMRIRDTGVGLTTPVSPIAGTGHHVGLAVMHERMTAIGGRLDWTAGDGGGVTVTARLPRGL